VPRLRPKQQEALQPFEFTEAVCVEAYSVGWADPIPKGRVYPADHWAVRLHPEFWRLLGPQPEEVNDGK
jgi:hypothetical protein